METSIISKYISAVKDEQHRYKSWDHCHDAFTAENLTDTHALHLGFYLASWGMYRGSGGLLQKNHLIHKGAVEILYRPEYKNLKCSENNEIDHAKIDTILDLKQKLSEHYNKISFAKGGNPST